MVEFISKKVTIVEDDESIIYAVKEILESQGYAVSTAKNGREALELFRKNGLPNLILLDMRMPVMDGWHFAEEFTSRYDHLSPIVVMTAANDAKFRADQIQADGWLGKPFALDALLSCVKDHVN